MLKRFTMFLLFILCFLFVGKVYAMPYSEEYKSDKFVENDKSTKVAQKIENSIYGIFKKILNKIASS